MIKIKIYADSYTLTPSEVTVGTRGSYGTSYLDITYSDDWKNLTKKVSFFPDDDTYPDGIVVVVPDGARCRVPDEIMASSGEFPFVVSGEDGADTLVSVTGKIVVLPTRTPSETPITERTPSELSQLYDMLNAALAAVAAAPVYTEIFPRTTVPTLSGNSIAISSRLNLSPDSFYRVTYGDLDKTAIGSAFASGDEVVLDLDGIEIREDSSGFRFILDDSSIVSSGYPIKIEEASFILPVATKTTLGGIKAKPKTAADTIEVHIDTNGFLWCAPSAQEPDDED